MGGLSTLMAVKPTQPLDFNLALAMMVVGSFISAGTLTADFVVRFGRNPKVAVVVAIVAFFLGNTLMFVFGAAGAASLGMADISDVMIAQGLLLPAIVVLGLNIWTTNDNALYASGSVSISLVYQVKTFCNKRYHWYAVVHYGFIITLLVGLPFICSNSTSRRCYYCRLSDE